MRIPDQNFVCDSCSRVLAGVVVALGRLLVLFLVGVELKDGSRPGAGVSANKLRRPDHFG